MFFYLLEQYQNYHQPRKKRTTNPELYITRGTGDPDASVDRSTPEQQLAGKRSPNCAHAPRHNQR